MLEVSPVLSNRLAVAVGVVATVLQVTADPRALQIGGPDSRDFALREMFDTDGSGQLDAAERRAAREHAEAAGLLRSRWAARAWSGQPGATGAPLTPEDARPYPTTSLYDLDTIRTLFFTFENEDWERELTAFKDTDIDVPATLVVDGRPYRNVGVQFHGNSSYMGVPMGFKRSMRVAVDFTLEDQRLEGYRTLLLLNAHEDPTFLRTVLALEISRAYFPAPKANWVRVVINGESWGLYVSQQQFNSDLARDLFGTSSGARWKIHGTRRDSGGGLGYLGYDELAYRRVYDLKSKDGSAPWEALIRLTRVLNHTPPAELERALAPHLDIDAALRFLAVENAIVNTDGYWTKASDYSLYLEPSGRFYLLPYDVNGTFATGFGPAGSRTGSTWLDPLEALHDPSKALAARLLSVPALRARYLAYVRSVATDWLDWERLGPVVARYQTMIDRDVREDTRKLVTYEAFKASADELRTFASERLRFLLEATSPGRGVE
jgi:hypothetical protein